MKSARLKQIAAMALLASAAGLMAAGNRWMSKVPKEERTRVNPYAAQPDAIAAGRTLFEDHCAKCHGADALGRHGRPSLRSEEVREASDGELAWILRNGSLWKGMPSWSELPEPERWQLIAYLRSLPPAQQDKAGAVDSN